MKKVIDVLFVMFMCFLGLFGMLFTLFPHYFIFFFLGVVNAFSISTHDIVWNVLDEKCEG